MGAPAVDLEKLCSGTELKSVVETVEQLYSYHQYSDGNLNNPGLFT